MAIGGVSIATEAYKLVRQKFANEISVQTMQRALKFSKFEGSCEEEKVSTFIEEYSSLFRFCQISRELDCCGLEASGFLYEIKINHFFSHGHYWCWA